MCKSSGEGNAYHLTNPKHGDTNMDTKKQPTPIRAKHIKAPRQWIQVMGRLSDPKRRAQVAKQFEKDHGHPMSNPDGYGMFVSYPVDKFGFIGAFEAAKEYIANEKEIHRDVFEWRLDGGQW